MRTPEEVAREIADDCVEGYYDRFYWDDARDILAAWADEVRAEMLADVHNIARVSTLTGTDVRLIIEAIRATNGLHWETSATLAGKWGGPFRRLVGPWEPVEP